jgi:hypothetical protein
MWMMKWKSNPTKPLMATTPSSVSSVASHSVKQISDCSEVNHRNTNLDGDPTTMERVVVTQHSPQNDKHDNFVSKDDGVRG